MRNKAILLGGGKGSRLEPLTVHKTKPTRKVCGVPMCVRVIENLEGAGVDEVYVATDYRATDVKGSVRRHYMGGAVVHFLEPHSKKRWLKGDEEPRFMGTADAVRCLSDDFKNSDDFIIASGDHVHNFPLGEALERHKWQYRRHGVYVTIIGCKKPRKEIVSRLGQFTCGSNGLVTRFGEKPRSIDEVFSNIASTGIYIASRKLLQYLKDNPGLHDFGYNVFGGRLLENGLMGSHVFGDEFFWSDIGTLEDYRLVNLEVAQGIRGIRNPYNYDRRTNSAYGKNAEIRGNVRDSVIGDGVHIGENSAISGSVLGDNVHIYNTNVIDSIIGDRARVHQSIGMERVALGEGVRLDHGRTVSREGLESNEYRIIHPFIHVAKMGSVDRNLTYKLEF